MSKKRLYLDVGRQIGHDCLMFAPETNQCSLRFVHPNHAGLYEQPVELSQELAEELLKFLPKGAYIG